MENFLDKVKKAAETRIVYTEHALDEMNAEEEIISKDEVRQVIFEGEFVEDPSMLSVLLKKNIWGLLLHMFQPWINGRIILKPEGG